jgi:ubiquinone/menaquinone biosynthesis C-methylase UbiE
LEHLEDLEGSLQEINRVLKPGGYFCTTVMTDNWEKYLLGKKIFGNRYLQYLANVQKHYNLLSASQWANIFNKCNFAVEQEVAYLSERNVRYLEAFHYLSIFSLFSKKVFDEWVLIKNTFKTRILSQFFYKIVEESLFGEIDDASAIFYVLKKKK